VNGSAQDSGSSTDPEGCGSSRPSVVTDLDVPPTDKSSASNGRYYPIRQIDHIKGDLVQLYASDDYLSIDRNVMEKLIAR